MEQTDIVGAAVGAALFSRRAFESVEALPDLAAAALWIPFFAGVSELVGQAYVLAARRIGGARAVASFALTGLVHVIAVGVWASACYLFLELDHIKTDTLATLLGVIALGYAPRLLGVFTIAPFFGEVLGRVLDAWAMACVAWGIWIVTREPPAPVLLCAGLGWVASLSVRRFGGFLLSPLLRIAGLSIAGMRRV